MRVDPRLVNKQHLAQLIELDLIEMREMFRTSPLPAKTWSGKVSGHQPVIGFASEPTDLGERLSADAAASGVIPAS